MVNLSKEQSVKIIEFIEENGLTQSMVKQYFNCKWKFYLKLSGLTFKCNSNKNTEFGTIVHIILEKWYKSRGLQFKNSKILSNFINTISDKYDMFFRDDVDEKRKIFYTMLAYFKIYENDFKNNEVLAIEKTFINNKFDQSGKIDLKYRNTKKNCIVIMDHKTKSRIEEDKLFEGLNLDFQSLFYLLNENDTIQVIINVIRNSQKKSYDISFYNEILREPEYYFKRYSITYTKKDISNFLTLWDKIKENIMDDIETLNIFPNFFHCTDNFKCEYLGYCYKKCKVNNNYEIKQFTYEELK
jgi:CRISPR/Cas system-associated exonuclease Cas4 (RecB family)